MPTTTVEATLLDRILMAHRLAIEKADETRGHARLALHAAWNCGALLNEAKEALQHGEWEDWLDEHCQEISQHTACRYMRLAKLSSLLDLDNEANLASAYRKAGILPEPEHSEPALSTVAPSYITYINLIDQNLKRLADYFDDYDPSKLTGQARADLKRLLEKIVAVYQKL